MPSKPVRARVGDIFQIPIASGRFALGQVVDQAGPQYLVVVFRSNTSVDEALRGEIQLAGIVFDAKLRNGDWPIVSNHPPIRVRAPWFVLGHDGLENLRIENFYGNASRLARPNEASKHRHRYLAGPLVLQRAVQAAYGQEDWRSEFDHFRDLATELGGLAE